MTVSYSTRCPLCNGALYPVVLGPDSAPWMCVICRHSWWVAELTADARKLFRAVYGDFGFGPDTDALRQAVEAERVEAVERGTSCREDQIALLPVAGLKWLVSRKVLPKQVKAEMKRKGG